MSKIDNFVESALKILEAFMEVAVSLAISVSAGFGIFFLKYYVLADGFITSLIYSFLFTALAGAWQVLNLRKALKHKYGDD